MEERGSGSRRSQRMAEWEDGNGSASEFEHSMVYVLGLHRITRIAYLLQPSMVSKDGVVGWEG